MFGYEFRDKKDLTPQFQGNKFLQYLPKFRCQNMLFIQVIEGQVSQVGGTLRWTKRVVMIYLHNSNSYHQS